MLLASVLCLLLSPDPGVLSTRAAGERVYALRKAKDWKGLVDFIDHLPPIEQENYEADRATALSMSSQWARLLERCEAPGKGIPPHMRAGLKGRALSELGRHREALAWFVACGKAGDEVAWLMGTNEAIVLADWKTLEECADALLLKHPSSGAYLGLKGEALTKQGQYAAAEKVLHKAVRLDPRRAMSWADLAFCLNGREAYQEAWEAADKGMALDPALLEAVCNRGRANLGLKRYKEGRDDYAAALALGPKDPSLAADLQASLRKAEACLAPKPPPARKPAGKK